MTILYPQEHFSCYNYEKGQNAALEILKREAGYTIVRDLVDTEIVFIIDGHFKLSYSKFVNLDITKGKILFFPPGSHVKAEVTEDAHLIICRVRGILQLCECLPLEHLHKEYEEKKNNEFYMLDINKRIYSFIENFVDYVNDGLRCNHFFATKMKELFFLLRAYYQKEELAAFFAPLMSRDAKFMNLMYKNYRNVKSVQELADIAMYSSSGFKKQFNRVFGTSASEWLSDQKAALVFQDLNNSDLHIKELADKHGFSSVSSFTNFCQNKFGISPGRIRKPADRKP
ncbi:AraC family transcriptional regulator [Bacteroides sp. 224]|uniref:helix-turn-helix domain-containing protein n=1 Tax=Bacteroides sp. 224 TaxID=2302936 RepID=UPI0013D71310|nr:AraC family transcriptional regulator [Bacteroides sp. 224]NDV64841.1 AraC family transcriptional regulator [Bacteroides sp. 224]